jgi:hypothetical protein
MAAAMQDDDWSYNQPVWGNIFTFSDFLFSGFALLT